MLTSPQSYIEELKNEPYEKLIKVRDKLIREIRHFEKHQEEMMNEEEMLCPSPEVVYVWNLQALGHLCALMSERFNEM